MQPFPSADSHDVIFHILRKSLLSYFPLKLLPISLLSFAAILLEEDIFTCFDVSNSLTSILSLTQSIQAFTPTNSIATPFVQVTNDLDFC